MLRLTANQLTAIILAVVAIGYMIIAFQIPDYALPRPVDSDAFPKALGATMLVLSALLYFEKPSTSTGNLQKRSTFRIKRQHGVRILVTSLAVVIYAVSIDAMGFPLCSWVLSFGLANYYGYREHVTNFVVTGTIVLSLYLLMTRILDVYLPSGPIPF